MANVLKHVNKDDGEFRDRFYKMSDGMIRLYRMTIRVCGRYMA